MMTSSIVRAGARGYTGSRAMAGVVDLIEERASEPDRAAAVVERAGPLPSGRVEPADDASAYQQAAA